MTPILQIRNYNENVLVMNFVIFFQKNPFLIKMPPDVIVYGFYGLGIIYRPMHDLKRPFLIDWGIPDKNISKKNVYMNVSRNILNVYSAPSGHSKKPFLGFSHFFQ